MPIPSFEAVLEICNQVDKCARVLQRTDDLAHELATPAGGIIDQEIGPDDTNDGEDTREDDAP